MIVKNIIKIVVSGLIPLLLLTSCGNDSTAPSDGVIEFNPVSEAKWEVGAGGTCTFIYPGVAPQLHIFRITVKSADGIPLGKVDLDLSLILTENSGVYAVSWLLIDLDNDGFFDGFDGSIASVLRSDELITSNVAGAPYHTQTNEFGWLEVGVMTDLGGCGYAGWLAVTSGTVGNTWAFEVEIA